MIMIKKGSEENTYMILEQSEIIDLANLFKDIGEMSIYHLLIEAKQIEIAGSKSAILIDFSTREDFYLDAQRKKTIILSALNKLFEKELDEKLKTLMFNTSMPF